MPIYDYTYQTWNGKRLGPLDRWLAIPKFTFMEYFGNRTFIWLFSVAWFQFVARLGWLYLLVNTEFLKMLGAPPTLLPAIDAYWFKSTIDIQLPFCVAFSFMLGANLISRDLAHNALVLYISKPISRWEYFFGKFSVVFFLALLLTWLQGSILYGLQLAVVPADNDWRIYFWDRYARLYPALTIYAILIAATLSLLILAASSMTRSGRQAGLIFAIYLIGTYVIGIVLEKINDMPNLHAISPLSAVMNAGAYLFKLPAVYTNVSATAAWVGILGNWAMCGFIIHWRMNNAAKFSR